MSGAAAGAPPDAEPRNIDSPFFEVPGNDSAPRLLLLSHYYPPSNAAGAQRWAGLTRLAHERGWAITVITIAPPPGTPQDRRALESLPPGTKIYQISAAPHFVVRLLHSLARLRRKQRSISPGSAQTGPRAKAPEPPRRPGSFSRSEIHWRPLGLRTLVRTIHAWLDFAGAAGWSREALGLARRLRHRTPFHAVISSGPPHMVHDAARQVSEDAGIPLIVDMRDPWSLQERVLEFVASPLWFRLARRYESRVVRNASLVVCNTAAARAALSERYPEAAGRIITVMNGHDDAPLPAPAPASRFILAYVGAIYLDRDPRPLFRALHRVVQELGLTPSDIGLEFMGDVSGYDGGNLEALAESEGVGGFVALHRPRPRAEAAAFMQQAALLISLPQDSSMAIPSKIFEYMCCHAWILAMAEPGSATALLLEGEEADVVSHTDIGGITDTIKKRVVAFRAGERATPLAASGRFSRREQARPLWERLESLVGSKLGRQLA